MRIAFRADASVTFGSGHVMRCLTLADQLREQGAETCFICLPLSGHMGEIITRRGHALEWLFDRRRSLDRPLTEIEDAAKTLDLLAGKAQWDWIVVDHYGLASAWERSMRKVAAKIMVIDDLANRDHDCDLLLDQNLQEPCRYDGRVPAGCQLLLGPRYALLRPQFAAARQRLRRRDGRVRRILVSFGGTDPSGATLKAIAALRQIGDRDLHIDVVFGYASPHRARVEAACRELAGCTLHPQVEDMAALMAQADLFIGAGGTTTWERCCMGLPAIVLATADNQIALSEALAQAGIQHYLGAAAMITSELLASEITTLRERIGALRSFCERGMQLVDGLGAVRVCKQMLV